MLEDKMLVWKFKAGSTEAFKRIYNKYESFLLTLAVNLLHDAAAAEDVVQDVFIKFVQSQEKFHLRTSLKAYLAVCTANRAKDILRKRNRLETVEENKTEAQIKDNNPIQLVINNEQMRLVRSALQQVPYEQREALILHLQGDMKFKAIAEVQNVSIKTTQSRYRYGLDKLRSILNSEVQS
ncbi:MAG: RNA polymerase sigma factor [Planctomycetota bacterium]|jgi:RNA polymerase sigma-70 factor (ECF subfamily)